MPNKTSSPDIYRASDLEKVRNFNHFFESWLLTLFLFFNSSDLTVNYSYIQKYFENGI